MMEQPPPRPERPASSEEPWFGFLLGVTTVLICALPRLLASAQVISPDLMLPVTILMLPAIIFAVPISATLLLGPDILASLLSRKLVRLTPAGPTPDIGLIWPAASDEMFLGRSDQLDRRRPATMSKGDEARLSETRDSRPFKTTSNFPQSG